MSPARTDVELVSAIEAMYRIRAVESPPDAEGQRTIWHRASRNAELVTFVDAEGKVRRQELMLFDDLVIWERGVGLRTGAIMVSPDRANKPSDSMTLDGVVDEERLGRVLRGLAAYGGSDRFIAHIREILKPAESAALGFEQQITRPSHQVLQALSEGKSASPAAVTVSKPTLPLAALLVGLVLVAVALLMIFWK